MSINTLREVHGLRGITMRYEEGGKVQVYKIGEKEVRIGPDATNAEIAVAFKESE